MFSRDPHMLANHAPLDRCAGWRARTTAAHSILTHGVLHTKEGPVEAQALLQVVIEAVLPSMPHIPKAGRRRILECTPCCGFACGREGWAKISRQDDKTTTLQWTST